HPAVDLPPHAAPTHLELRATENPPSFRIQVAASREPGRVTGSCQYKGLVKPTAIADPVSAPSTRTTVAPAVKRRSAVNFAAAKRQSTPIGAKRNGRVKIATIPKAAAATESTTPSGSLLTTAHSSSARQSAPVSRPRLRNVIDAAL